MSLDFTKEFLYLSSRSGGKGGQNVNKVETSIHVRWSLADSKLLDKEQKERVAQKLKKRISKDGWILIQCSNTRSQLENKEIARNRLNILINKALLVVKKRKLTKIPKSAVEKRLTGKKISSLKKANRRNNFD